MNTTFDRENGALAAMDRKSLDSLVVERLVIHQPNLFPRLKVLQKIVRGDAWVVLDDVQYVAREWQNRIRMRHLKRPEHEFWLTIPVHLPLGRESTIQSVSMLDFEQFGEHLKRAIWYCYHQSTHWDWIDMYISTMLSVESQKLTDICVRSVQICLSALGISKPLLFSSSVHARTKKTSRLIEICKAFGAKTYVSGSGGRSYLDQDAFSAANIAIEWQFWTAPENIPERLALLGWRNITFLDLVARCGPNVLKEHLLSWNEERM